MVAAGAILLPAPPAFPACIARRRVQPVVLQCHDAQGTRYRPSERGGGLDGRPRWRATGGVDRRCGGKGQLLDLVAEAGGVGGGFDCVGEFLERVPPSFLSERVRLWKERANSSGENPRLTRRGRKIQF